MSQRYCHLKEKEKSPFLKTYLSSLHIKVVSWNQKLKKWLLKIKKINLITDVTNANYFSVEESVCKGIRRDVFDDIESN